MITVMDHLKIPDWNLVWCSHCQLDLLLRWSARMDNNTEIYLQATFSRLSLSVLREILEHQGLGILLLFLSLCLTIFLVLRQSVSKPRLLRYQLKRQDALQALLSVITPTRSRWPPTYFAIARRAIASQNQTIAIPLDLLVEDVIHGRIELRNPKINLPKLIQNDLRVEGWHICLQVGVLWWFRVLLRRLATSRSKDRHEQARLSYLPFNSGKPETIISQQTESEIHDMDGKTAPTLGLSSSLKLIYDLSSGPTIHTTLDEVSQYQLKPFIRTWQSSVPPGSTALLSFSVRATPLAFSNPSFILAALPYFPRSYTKNLENHHRYPPTACRTLTPLVTSLDQVINVLTSGSSPFTIESVMNATEEYTECLTKYVERLEASDQSRKVFAARWGLKGWREERFSGSWECALFSTGVLTRWVVMVRK